jgi:thioesterase domain-containing protein
MKAQLNWLLDHAYRSQALAPDDLRRQFELYLADIKALKNYHPPAASFPLLLLRAADESEVPETLERWTSLSSNELEVHNVPGDHLSMMRPPHVTTLAERLRYRFAQIPTKTL